MAFLLSMQSWGWNGEPGRMNRCGGRVECRWPGHSPSPQATQVASGQLWQMWLLLPPVTAWCPGAALLQEPWLELAGNQD